MTRFPRSISATTSQRSPQKPALFLVLALSIFLFVQCSNSDQTNRDGDPGAADGRLNVALWASLPTLDWQSTVSHPLPHCMLPVFEGLFGLGKDFSPAPELVELWTVSDDKLTWTFTVRAGVLFHNEEEMTAEDVKASIERWQRVSPRGVMLNDLREIEIVGKHTVALHFDKPIGRFLMLILAADESKAVIMPKEIAQASTQAGALTAIVGTGPYRFAEYRTEQYLRLVRFSGYVSRNDPPNYHAGGKRADVEEIIFWIVPETSTRVAGLERGEYDIITRLPDSEFTRLKEISDIEPIVNVPASLDYLIFNHKQGIFTDINMRRAVQSAVNAEEINRSMVASEAFWTLNPSIYPPESRYHTDEAASYFNQNDPEQAKAFLRQANYAGQPVKFLVLREEPESYRASITLAEQLKAVGIKVDFLVYDLATWVAKRANPEEMDMFITKGYWLDPSLFHAEFGGRFPGWFISPETEAVFNQLALETDFEKRFELGRALQRLFYEKVAFVNVGYHYGGKARRSAVNDPEGNLTRGNLTLHHVGLRR